MSKEMSLETLMSKPCENFCHYCQETMNRVGCCDKTNWFTCCTSCSEGLPVCPQCKDPKCRMKPIGVMYREDLYKLFGNKGLFKLMNPSMFIKFDKNEVKIGVTQKPILGDSLSRGIGAQEDAAAVAYVLENEGCVKLEGDEEFATWTVVQRRVAELCAGVNMGRSVRNHDGTFSTRVLGDALPWAKALMYQDTKDGYPTLVGKTTSGRVVQIALACNDVLPGFLLRAYNTENAQTLVSPVDIPARVFLRDPPVNDPRVKVLRNKHAGGDARVLSLCVGYTMTGKAMEPKKTYEDDDGCLWEEYDVERCEMELRVRSLSETVIFPQHVSFDGEITMEGIQTLEKFWCNKLSLKSELTDKEDHEGWEILVPGPDGCLYPIYKVTYKLLNAEAAEDLLGCVVDGQ